MVLETVKKAEHEDAVILRMYDASGGEQAVRLETALNVRKAMLTNMQEEDVEEIAVAENAMHLTFGSFEIKTVKLFL